MVRARLSLPGSQELPSGAENSMMTQSKDDIWSEWLLRGRFGSDPARAQAVLDYLHPVRDRVLDNAALAENATLLDVGCGDGLIAFGALRRWPSARVIFSDISRPLLDQARQLAEQAGCLDRCQFHVAAADNLAPISDDSVDAVTTRSVLIYVKDKPRAFKEFHRVLRAGGRLSIFEPINRFGHPEPRERFCGLDVTPVIDLAAQVKAVFETLQPMDNDPMLDFDERDLLALVEAAGFRSAHLTLEAAIEPNAPVTWDAFVNTPGNPKIPSLAEAVKQSLTPEEGARLMGHLREEFGAGRRVTRSAVAYLWAEK